MEINPSPQVNPSVFVSRLPAREQSLSPLSFTQQVATQQLETINRQETPGILQSKSIRTPTDQKGVWNAIKRFCKRHFFMISQSKQQQALDIKTLIGEVEKNLHQISIIAKQTMHREKQLHKRFPSDQSVEIMTTYLNEARQLLKQTKEDIKALKEYESLAVELADQYSTFDPLPLNIQRVEKNVLCLEDEISLTDNLLCLEMAMNDYSHNKTWDQFANVQDQRRDCSEAESITLSFHSLTSYVKRLFNAALEMQKERLNNLDQQVKDVTSLLSKYRQQSNQIRALETSIYDNSMVGRIYKVFHHENKMRKKREQILDEQAKTYEKILIKGTLDHGERDWLSAVVNINPREQNLKKRVEWMLATIASLEREQRMSVQMNHLLHSLEFRRYHPCLTQSLSSRFIHFKGLNHAIKDHIQELAKPIENWQFKEGALPLDFRRMDLLDQLKSLLSASFPALRQRNHMIFKFIDKEKLRKELNLLLEGGSLEATDAYPLQKQAETLEEPEKMPTPTKTHSLPEKRQAPPIPLPPPPPPFDKGQTTGIPLVSAIHKGVLLNRIGDRLAKGKSTLQELLRQVQAGFLKMQDISQEDISHLSLHEQMQLNMGKHRKLGIEPSNTAVETEEWKNEF